MEYLTELPSTADAVIVGGGIVGATTAFHLSRRGIRSLLLEARPRLCTLTTPVATGAFRLQFDNPEELELVKESVSIFLNFANVTEQRTYDPAVRQQGYLWLTTTEAGVERQRALVQRQHSWGLTDVELLSGDETRARFPYIGKDVLQARFRAGDGTLDPKAVTMGFASASGCRVVTSCRVVRFVEKDGRLTGVETERGTVSTRAAILAAGPLSGPLAQASGIELPIHTVIRQKVIMPDAEAVPAWAPMTIDDDTGVHWRPALRGAYLLHTDPSTPPSPPTDHVPLDHASAFSLMDPASAVSVARISPFWKTIWDRGDTNWLLQAGQYTMTPDHRPLIGRSAIEGLFINTGYSGHGIMGSAAGSRILADLIAGRLQEQGNPYRLHRQFAPRELDVL